MVMLYNALDRDGRVVYRNMQVIRLTDSGAPMYGWPTGGFIDPLDVASGLFTIVPSKEEC